MFRRYLKKILVLWLSYSLFLIPVKQAEAAINTQNMAGTTLASAGSLGVVMGLATGAAVAVTGGLALGLVGAAILIDNAVNSSSTASNTALSINLNPKVPLITPPGWTAPVAPATQPSPPSTTNASGTFTITGATGTFTNPLAACTAYLNANYPGSTPSVNAVQPFTCYKNGSAQQSINGSYVCPTGYTLNGSNSSSCNVSTPSAVIKPVMGKHTIMRSGNTLVVDPQMNPTDKLPSNIVSLNTSDVTVSDSTGSTTKVVINSDGTATITRTVPRNDGTNKTDITTVTMSAPDATTGDVTVTGTNTQEGSGTGKAASTTPVTTGATGSSIDVTSLNKETTQQQIKLNLDNIKDNVKDIRDGVKNESNTPVDLADQKTDYDTKAQEHSDKIKAIGDNGLDHHGVDFNWFPDIPTAGCSPLSAGFAGRTITLDLCPTVYKLKDLFGYCLYVLTGYTLFNVFTGRRED